MRKRIAILGADEHLKGCYQQAKALGYYIVGIATPEGAVARPLCDAFYPISFAEREQVLDICRKEHVDGITSFTLESALPTLSYVVNQMGLTGNSLECMKRVATKYSQRVACYNAGIPSPWFRIVREEDMSSVMREASVYPLIVKPVDSGGSQGIHLVENKSQLMPALEDAMHKSKTHIAIVEQYIDGREFSVEFISHRGKHYLLQITDKVTSGAPLFVEMNHHQPANISMEIRNRIERIVSDALTALCITDSASHTEIKLNSQGELFIIETGARMGGGHITSDLVRLSTGYDMVRGVLELACGCFTEPVFNLSMYSGIYFYSQLAPNVRQYIENRALYPEIVEAEIVDRPLVPVTSNLQRNGYFIYQSSKGRFNIE